MKKYLVSFLLLAFLFSYSSCVTSNHTRRYYRMHKIGYRIMKKQSLACPMFPKPLYKVKRTRFRNF